MSAFTSIRLGTTNIYLVKCLEGVVLIDAGRASMVDRFQKELSLLSINSQDIILIIITHAHYDHVGSLSDIKELTKAKVLVHKNEAREMSKGVSEIPKGTTLLGKIASYIGNYSRINLGRFDPVEPDILIDNEFDLLPYGLNGKVIPTPGHTFGSISVILDSGEAFVGDTCFNVLPFYPSVFPPLASDINLLLQSWEKLIKSNSKYFFPAHGLSFSRDKLIHSYERKVG